MASLIFVIASPLVGQSVSYEIDVDEALTPYVNDISQLGPTATFEAGDNIRSTADFSIKNTYRDPIFVRVYARMRKVGAEGNPWIPGAEYDSDIVEIASGATVNFEDVGVEYDTPDPCMPAYVVVMAWRVSLDSEMDPVNDAGTGGWSNTFTEADDNPFPPLQ